MPGPLRTGDLVLCSGTIRAAPFAETVEAAAAAGFQGISLYYDEYRAARSAGWSDSAMRTFLDDHGIAVAEIDGRSSWLPGDAAAPTSDDFLRAAAALRARSVTVLEITGTPIADSFTIDAVAQAFGSVCDRAIDTGLLVHIEFFPFSGIPDATTAYEITRRADRPNGGVLLDCWHHLRGPDAGRLPLEIPGSAVLAVQANDIATERSDDPWSEMMHNRALPGTGVGRTADILRALRAGGCTAPMEVEVYSDALSALPPKEAAQQAADALRRVMTQAGIE